jgi:hypothetical protein
MTLTGRWCIRTLTITASSWSDIVIPVEMKYGCSQVIIRCDVDTIIYGDKTQVLYQDQLKPTIQQIIGSPGIKSFNPGNVVCNIKGLTIGGDVKLTFTL